MKYKDRFKRWLLTKEPPTVKRIRDAKKLSLFYLLLALISCVIIWVLVSKRCCPLTDLETLVNISAPAMLFFISLTEIDHAHELEIQILKNQLGKTLELTQQLADITLNNSDIEHFRNSINVVSGKLSKIRTFQKLIRDDKDPHNF